MLLTYPSKFYGRHMVSNAQILEALCDGNLGEALYTPGAIANWFLHKSAQEKTPLQQMKLQKLMYFAHGWCLSERNAPLINEPVEAWEYGPVFSSIYHEFKKYGKNTLPTSLSSYMHEITSKDNGLHFVRGALRPNDQETEELLTCVWNKYSMHTGLVLSDMTHREDPLNPWQMIYDKIKGHNIRSMDIPNRFIKEFFDSLRARELDH